MNEAAIKEKSAEITSTILHNSDTKTVSVSDAYDIWAVYEDMDITVKLIKKANNSVEKTRTVNRYEAEHLRLVVVDYLQTIEKSKKKFFGLF